MNFEASANSRFRLCLRIKAAKAITTITKPASPASPKTNPARGLFCKKEVPLEVPVEEGAVVEVVSVTVICPPGVVESGGVDPGGSEGTLQGSNLSVLARMIVCFSVPGSCRRGGSGCGL